MVRKPGLNTQQDILIAVHLLRQGIKITYLCTQAPNREVILVYIDYTATVVIID